MCPHCWGGPWGAPDAGAGEGGLSSGWEWAQGVAGIPSLTLTLSFCPAPETCRGIEAKTQVSVAGFSLGQGLGCARAEAPWDRAWSMRGRVFMDQGAPRAWSRVGLGQGEKEG